jgi:hypothetical protein
MSAKRHQRPSQNIPTRLTIASLGDIKGPIARKHHVDSLHPVKLDTLETPTEGRGSDAGRLETTDAQTAGYRVRIAHNVSRTSVQYENKDEIWSPYSAHVQDAPRDHPLEPR